MDRGVGVVAHFALAVDTGGQREVGRRKDIETIYEAGEQYGKNSDGREKQKCARQFSLRSYGMKQ
jgi:hypothetical protein